MGADFHVNDYTTSSQSAPAVARGAGGGFVVVWQSYGADGSGYGVRGRRFDALGAPLGGEFPVNTFTTGAQRYAAVASDANGNFVAVWNSFGQDGSGYGVHAQRFDAGGNPVGGEFQVNTYTTNSQVLPSVAADAGGNFVVVWSDPLGDGDYYGIRGRRFDASGAAQGGEFQVNAYTNQNQRSAAVAASANGNFVVVWIDDGQTDEFEIVGRRFGPMGAPAGDEFRVNTFTTDQQIAPSIAADPRGNFVVAWQSAGQDGDGYGVFGRLFDAEGRPGAELQANSFTTAGQYLAAVSLDPRGSFVVAWTSLNQDGSFTGIFGQRYTDVVFADGFQ